EPEHRVVGHTDRLVYVVVSHYRRDGSEDLRDVDAGTVRDTCEHCGVIERAALMATTTANHCRALGDGGVDEISDFVTLLHRDERTERVGSVQPRTDGVFGERSREPVHEGIMQ